MFSLMRSTKEVLRQFRASGRWAVNLMWFKVEVAGPHLMHRLVWMDHWGAKKMFGFVGVFKYILEHALDHAWTQHRITWPTWMMLRTDLRAASSAWLCRVMWGLGQLERWEIGCIFSEQRTVFQLQWRSSPDDCKSDFITNASELE